GFFVFGGMSGRGGLRCFFSAWVAVLPPAYDRFAMQHGQGFPRQNALRFAVGARGYAHPTMSRFVAVCLWEIFSLRSAWREKFSHDKRFVMVKKYYFYSFYGF
ncbi:MAG: hypothetical protein Q4D61_03635, partial [Cardiobacteriaceae bacterium]|nr:hypothetical protein [Cardiobacteriaceae bacterium]